MFPSSSRTQVRRSRLTCAAAWSARKSCRCRFTSGRSSSNFFSSEFPTSKFRGAVMANVPENLHYSKDHEWVRVEGDTAVIGITDHAQDQLGDVVFVELPKA